jgi:hypothetical protein
MGMDCTHPAELSFVVRSIIVASDEVGVVDEQLTTGHRDLARLDRIFAFLRCLLTSKPTVLLPFEEQLECERRSAFQTAAL